jgi:acyl-CoA thioesterase
VSEELIRRYMAQDRLAATLGIELAEVGPGRATTRLTIDERHLNGAGIVHGGTIFSLADVAFAAASNSGGTLALALDVSITFLKAVSTGTLTARAEEERCQGRIGCYSLRVEDGSGELVALFRGTVYRKKTPLAELLSGAGQTGEVSK